MTDDDKPKAERETAEGREVYVTKDESGITSLAEEEEAADPRVTTEDENSESEQESSDSDEKS
jgi:hypothetical protein